MELIFEKGVNGKYSTLSIKHGIDKLPSNLDFNSNVYCINDTEADKLINYSNELNKHIHDTLKVKELSFNPMLILLTYFQAIDSIASGLDVRSNISFSDLAERFVDGYEKSYNEALEFCQKTKKHASENLNESYMKNWKNYDRANELVKLYQLDESLLINYDDFNISLKKLLNSGIDLLELLKAENANNEGGKS